MIGSWRVDCGEVVVSMKRRISLQEAGYSTTLGMTRWLCLVWRGVARRERVKVTAGLSKEGVRERDRARVHPTYGESGRESSLTPAGLQCPVATAGEKE